MEQLRKELEEFYELGVKTGRQQMMNKMENHYKMGKPVMINGNLYWLKDARQHLVEIMDSLEEK